MTAAQLDHAVAAYRGVVAVSEGHERSHERRSVTWRHDEDGSLLLRCRLPAEEGAIVLAAIEAAREALDRDRLVAARTATTSYGGAVSHPAADESAASADSDEASTPTNADAFLLVADRSLATAEEARRTGGERYQVVLELDEATLAGAQDATAAVTGDGVALPADAARRIACDATVVRSHNGRAGRRVRTIPSAVRRGLRRRDRGCRFPGCTHRRYVDAHHIEHWANGGASTLDNLVELCRHHHRLLHEGGYSVAHDRGELVFRRPDGRRLSRSPRLPHGRASAVCADASIGADTTVPRWDGQHLDLGLAVDALLQAAPPGQPKQGAVR